MIGFPTAERVSLRPAENQRQQLRSWIEDNFSPEEKVRLDDLCEVASRYVLPPHPQSLFAEHDQRALAFATERFQACGINPDGFYLFTIIHDMQQDIRRNKET